MPFYALDIETDTEADRVDPQIPAGLDPQAGRIVSVAVCGASAAAVFDDTDERFVLDSLTGWLQAPGRESGVVVTWNGSGFDVPYLSDRHRTVGAAGRPLLVASRARPPKYGPLPGHSGGYLARFGRHGHADVAFAWKAWAASQGVAWSLKPVAVANGIDVIEVDRERVGALTVAERAAYNLSDVNATLQLARLAADRGWLEIDVLS